MGIDYDSVAAGIRTYAQVLNSLYNAIVSLLCNTSFINSILTDESLKSLMSIIKGTAITLCVLFFLIDFFAKTMHLQWVTWENVLMLCLKLTVAKLAVDNAEWITTTIYSGFTELAGSISASRFVGEFIPTTSEMYGFFLTSDEVAKLYEEPSWFLDLSPMFTMTKVNILGWIMIIIMYVANIVVIGRMFELTVYTIIAPIPLSTLACDGLQDIGKNFLKSYAAVTLQAIVLIIMFLAFNAVQDMDLIAALSLDGWKAMVLVLTLGLCVMQSGSWAKRITGAM